MFIKFLISLLPTKKLRNQAREYLIKSQTRNYKLGVTYNVFDGEELLESSIKSIRQNVNYINVIFQRVSNFNQQASPELYQLLLDLQAKGLIDEIIEYTTDFNIQPSDNELNKRSLGLKHCKKNHCTHILNMDVDEFYEAEEFKNTKQYIYDNNIYSSACAMYYYVQQPEYRFESPRRTMYVPFICKIPTITKYKLGQYFPVLIDPTRALQGNKKFKLFNNQELTMHHMAYVRKDLESKFANSTCQQMPELQDKLQSLHQEVLNYKYPNDFNFYGEGTYKILKVHNQFEIPKL